MTDRRRAIEQDLRTACARLGIQASGDWRISERDAASLLCLNPGTLKNMRKDGSGPVAHRTPMNGCQVSFSIADLAHGSCSAARHPMTSDGID